MPKTPLPKPDAAGELKIEKRPGYIEDYISGVLVKATPEETESVQVFARRLVEDYGYDRLRTQTRPQFRVRRRPSDEEKSYPVDIAVFTNERKLEEDLYLIVECKQKTRKDGVAQLKLYMDMSPAEVGVWFNGDEHEYIRKIHHKDGRRTYEILPNIPREGQRIEDIGRFRRQDLRRPSNLKAVFRDIRRHLAGKLSASHETRNLQRKSSTFFSAKSTTRQIRGETKSYPSGRVLGSQPTRSRNGLSTCSTITCGRSTQTYSPPKIPLPSTRPASLT
jgi:Type I restriction enzyme R protein N terminus (HSDR_N)